MTKARNYARKYAKDFNFLTWLYQRYAIYCLFTPFMSLFYDIKFSGEKNVKKGVQYLYAANHISYFDPFLVAIAGIKNPMAFVAKKELYEASNYLAKNMSRLGAFSVNREKTEVSTMKSAKEVFKAGWSLCIFPQGGIKKNKKIEIINKGFVFIAKMAKADIVPVAIEGLEDYNWKLFKRAPVSVSVGEPISHRLGDEEIIRCWRAQISELSGYEICNEEQMLQQA